MRRHLSGKNSHSDIKIVSIHSSHTSNVNCHLHSNSKQEVDTMGRTPDLLHSPTNHLCKYRSMTASNKLIWYTSQTATQSMRMTMARSIGYHCSNKSRSNRRNSIGATKIGLARQEQSDTNSDKPSIDSF